VGDLDALACKAQAGCLVSFERIVELNRDRLFSYLLQLVGNPHDAEELAQDTFVKAWKHLHSFDGRARFSTWLYAIAKNSAFTHLRKRRPSQPIDEMAESLPAPDYDHAAREYEPVWKVARLLKPSLFEALWLFYAEGFSLKEVAEITGTNPITVRVNLHRARAALKKKCRFHGIEL
jgi:RNA polymerase sigma-70 factor (ECF subfamily)